MKNEEKRFSNLFLNKKALIATSAAIFLTLSNVSSVQAEESSNNNSDDRITEVNNQQDQQINNIDDSVDEKENYKDSKKEISESLTSNSEESSDSSKKSGEELKNTQDDFNNSLEELMLLLTEEQNEIFTSLISSDKLTDLFKESLINHQANEFTKASEIYEYLSTNFEITKKEEELLYLFNQLAEKEINLLNHTFSDQDPIETDSETSEEDDQIDNKVEEDNSKEDTETTDELQGNDSESELETFEREEAEQNPEESNKSDEEPAEISSSSVSSQPEAQTRTLSFNEMSSIRNVNYRGYLTNSSDIIYSDVDDSSEHDEREVGNLQGLEVKVLEEGDAQQTTWAYIEVVGQNISGWIDKTGIEKETVSSQQVVNNYRGYLARTNDTINTQPWGTPGYEEIRRVEDLKGNEVKVLEEAETQRATWLYVDVIGTNISGWIDKTGIEKETVSSQQAVSNYRGYLARTNDTINTQPWGTPGYEEIRRVEDLKGNEVKVLEEAETQRATWLYVDVMGTNISGWIDKAGIEEETISSHETVNSYRGYLMRSNDTINTQPWGTPGYEEIRRVEDLKGNEVKVLEEAETQRATWLYVDVMGTNISGWIDKAGIEEETISSHETVNSYRGYLMRSNDTINTQPWGTPGHEEVRRVEGLQGNEVKVLEEAETQRATWLYVDVIGTNISGWIDKAGIEEEAVSSQENVNYRGFLTRPNDTINTQPWGTPSYQEIRRVNDLEDQEVHVTQEATTQRAEWAHINVVGTDISGWVDKAGIEQASIAYRTTYYGQTFEETLNIQMQNGYPQTDSYGNGWQNARREDAAHYLNPENFVNIQNGSTPVNIELVQVATGALNVRTGPSTSYQPLTTIERNEVYEVLDQSNGWYKINLGENTGWISSGYVTLISEVQYSNLPDNKIATVNTAALNVRQGPSTNDSIVTQIHNNETYKVLDQSNGWYKIDINGTEGWASGNYLNISDSIDSETLQFLSLSSPSGITVSDLNKELEGRGILENQGAAFIEASRQYNINEIYLVSHALLETGHGSSELATGVEVNGVTVYNMFGIGAYDGNALTAGSKRAYEEGWDTPRKAIIGGAEFIANSYINSPVHKQDTLYKMKWNPSNPSVHQYATDIGWAVKQTNILDQIIELSNEYNLALKFDIPIYQ